MDQQETRAGRCRGSSMGRRNNLQGASVLSARGKVDVGGLRMREQALAMHAIWRNGVPDLDLMRSGKAG